MFHEAKPSTFDPAKTFLVASGWHDGIGCPTGTSASSDGVHRDGPVTDPACPTGDAKDKKNQGLLLATTGPTGNFAAGVAELKDVKGQPLTELGYDLRKPGGDPSDSRGSHCGFGAPRFNVTTTDGGFYFIGCNSPAQRSPPAALPGSACAGL